MSSKVRETLYLLGTIVPGVIGVALIWGGLDPSSAENISQVLVGLLSMAGASAPAKAAREVHKQRKDGLFDNPADQVTKSVQKVIEAQASATADLERVKQTVTSAVGTVPGMGPLAQQLINGQKR